MVIVRDEHEASLRWAGNSMTTNGSSVSRRWAVISVFRDGPTRARVGTIASTSVDPDDIEAVVRASEEAARGAEPARDAMPLLEPDAVDDDWSAPAGGTGIEVFADLAEGLSAGFDSADRLYGFAHHQMHTTWLGTSTGIRRRFVQPTGSVEINGKRGEGADLASAWVGVGTADFADVDVSGLLADLARRLDWAKRKIELPAGRYETLLPPSTVADLMIYLAWSMEGRGAQEGHTAFARAGGTRVGERLSEIPLTLYSDPHAPGLEYQPFVAATASSESMSVFDNGLTVERVDWLRDGVISALIYPRATAAEFDAPVTIPGDNLLLTGGSQATIDDMIARTERGLLLTTLWYIREVDPATLLLTGLTRDGVYLVENGEVTAAVNNFRFNESPLDLLRRVSEAGATELTLPREWKDWFTRTAMPPLRIPDFHMSSVSQAT
ncbi:metallopeptidase TldD-related protein [Nocardia sp. CDC186]|uniref:Metallopeptidase TldD-related protein n=1 Tax=Nocardia implantans TaxID=3108168 RepID=A0ABU6AW19_9NOCA|nr:MULTISPECIES: metallopeptidase TldD-related protein [unclassified Nocardia]MBF6192459.1 TldD/PmbA family protein [Nocardia beijingensis]MEA3527636.1 metallopeptidase TldD-related protein [Nocardia sp. CDC192]MEB3511344.1 metallopeptidase TldD-related protein [Nocardia sp. CDC186]